jgi:hypothetical protein
MRIGVEILDPVSVPLIRSADPHSLAERRTLAHRDVLGLVTLDLILRVVVCARMAPTPFVIDTSRMDRHDRAADASSPRAPARVIAYLSRFAAMPFVRGPPDSS